MPHLTAIKGSLGLTATDDRLFFCGEVISYLLPFLPSHSMRARSDSENSPPHDGVYRAGSSRASQERGSNGRESPTRENPFTNLRMTFTYIGEREPGPVWDQAAWGTKPIHTLGPAIMHYLRRKSHTRPAPLFITVRYPLGRKLTRHIPFISLFWESRDFLFVSIPEAYLLQFPISSQKDLKHPKFHCPITPHPELRLKNGGFLETPCKFPFFIPTWEVSCSSYS